MNSEKITTNWHELMPAIVVLVLAVTFLLWAQIYEGRGRVVPTLVGWVTIVLATLDIVSHTGTRLGNYIGQVLSGTARASSKTAPESKRLVQREVVAILWISGFITLVAVFGFLATIPFYMVLFMRVQGRMSWRQSIIVAIVTTLFVWLAFELLLRYNVYGGLLFED